MTAAPGSATGVVEFLDGTHVLGQTVFDSGVAQHGFSDLSRGHGAPARHAHAALADARRRAAAAEREAVAVEVRQLFERSSLSKTAIAAHIGTSASRLSTYASGKLTPSAGFLVRKRRVAGLTAAGVAISNI